MFTPQRKAELAVLEDPSAASMISGHVKEGKSVTESELAYLDSLPHHISEYAPEIAEVIKPRVIYKSGPCASCNIPLEKGCKIVAITGIILGFLLLAVGLGFVFGEFVDTKTNNGTDPEKFNFKIEAANAICAAGFVCSVRGSIYIPLFFTLGFAASKRHRCLCKAWVTVYISVIIVSFVVACYTCTQYRYAAIILSSFVTIFLEIYFNWVVIAFIEELKVVGVVGGNPVIANRDIFDGDMFTMGIYGPGTESGEQTPVPLPKYLSKTKTNEEGKGEDPVEIEHVTEHNNGRRHSHRHHHHHHLTKP